MLKVKIIAIFGILLTIGIVFGSSRTFSSAARGDVLEEIAAYKAWTRITKEPIKVSSYASTMIAV